MRTRTWTALTLVTVMGLALAGAAVAKSFDLKDLKDGETRELGEGDHKVTATRTGDSVKVAIKTKEGEDKSFSFDLGKGDATLLSLTGDDPGCQAFRFETKSEDGKEKEVKVIALASGHGGGGKACMFMGGDGHKFLLEGDDPLMLSGADGDVMIEKRVGRMLRCPEGDATMHLEESDGGTYYCPKHNVALEESKGPHIVKRIVITEDGDKDEAK